MNNDEGTIGPFLPVGTKVRNDLLDEGGPEFGVVVYCWMNEEIGAHDCYVAFFGKEFPTGLPKEKPYILRYASLSLTVVTE